jgi:queuine tRNA-ribosyltransferase
MNFSLLAIDGAARRGRLETPRGAVETPAFMPVGTAGTVKALGPDDLHAAGAQIILGNTYHLMLRPGEALVERAGGLHAFMAWDRPILTDSGGFQIFSLAARRSVSEEGVTFRSHLDGSPQQLSPERSVQIQQRLGADILMAFDECPSADVDRAYLEESLERTARWALRCRDAWNRDRGALFGIVQGGLDPELRRRSAEQICALDLPGYALGGFSVGEEKRAMLDAVAYSTRLLPADRPRYLMGVGTPDDLLSCIAEGVDMFDCVLPTRCARNGLLFTSRGRLPIRNQQYAEDPRPVDERCACYTCKTFSRAYLRHLFTSKELLSYRLNSLHNVTYYLALMAGARAAIAAGTFARYLAETRAGWLELANDGPDEELSPTGPKSARGVPEE